MSKVWNYRLDDSTSVGAFVVTFAALIVGLAVTVGLAVLTGVLAGRLT